MARKYYSLVVNDAAKGEAPNWGVQFGDYSRDCVEEEREEYLRDYPARCIKIICTGAGQADIDAAVSKLNDWRK